MHKETLQVELPGGFRKKERCISLRYSFFSQGTFNCHPSEEKSLEGKASSQVGELLPQGQSWNRYVLLFLVFICLSSLSFKVSSVSARGLEAFQVCF